MTIALSALLGVLTWSFLEYVIHRWLGHDRRFVRGRRNLFGKEHTLHHSRGDYFAPTWKKLLVALAFLAIVAPPAILLAGVPHGVVWAVGLVGFYGFYEWLHRSLHVRQGVGPYARWARLHHFHHHFGSPAVNHGVTSPLWDIVFGTHVKVERVVVPEKLAMRWLRDHMTGAFRTDLGPAWEVRPAHGRTS